jgi:hypothetical protein
MLLAEAGLGLHFPERLVAPHYAGRSALAAFDHSKNFSGGGLVRRQVCYISGGNVPRRGFGLEHRKLGFHQVNLRVPWRGIPI